MMHPAHLADLAVAIADGTPIDWQRVESDTPDLPPEIAVRARIVERIAQLHAALPGADVFSSSLHKSLQGVRLPGDDADTAETPLTWGPLTIVGKIGRGTFGDVYRAHDPRLDRPVALKLLRRKDRLESAVIDEGHLMARVRHPNVVTVYGAERIDGRVGLWMEFVDGLTLEEELKARGPFTPNEVVKIGLDLSRALAAVHRAGLLHRDLKAQNVMRDADGRVLLTDFGAGRELAGQSNSGHELAGTPLYLAPEVLAGQPASAASDIYSLGVLLYHLATSSFPIRGRTLDDLRRAHAGGAREALETARPDLPQSLAAAIERALNRDPAQRYGSTTQLETALAKTVRRRSPGRIMQIAAAALILVSGAAVAGWKWRQPSAAAQLSFKPRDPVLIARFDSRTGEDVLDGTLEYALQRELSNSLFVNVASRERVADTLQLMQKPADTRLDEVVGREVALRDGEIRTLISGRLEKVAGSYAITADIRRPADGSIVASVAEASVAQSELLRAVGRVALGIRERLGEAIGALETNRGVQLPRVTTSSLRALQLYSQVVAMQNAEGIFNGREKAAEQLLRETLKEDPGFASAHRLLSNAVRLDGQRSGHSRLAEALQHIERAVALAGSVGRVERLVNDGELHYVRAVMARDVIERTQHFERAAAAFEAALQLQPNHPQALICLTNVYRGLGRPNATIAGRLADLRPNSATWQMRAAEGILAANPRERDVARRYVQRARAIQPVDQQSAMAVASARLFDANEAWTRNNPREAMTVADRMSAEMLSLPREAADVFGAQLVSVNRTLGRFDKAEAFAAHVAPNSRKSVLIRVMMLRERPDALRDLLTGDVFDIEEASSRASPLFEAGLLRQLRAAVAALKNRPGSFPPYTLLAEGQLALAEGRLDEAINLFQRCRQPPETLEKAPDQFMRAALKETDAWVAKREMARAIDVLENTSRTRDTVNWPLQWGYTWLPVRERLSQLYRIVGRISEAETIESELLQLLAVADDDHPIARRLLALRAAR